VILQQAGSERSEIELMPPVEAAPSDEPLPAPVCPQGIPTQYGALPEELPPGVSALDDYLAQRDAQSQDAPEQGGQA
jgi:hypothetical protein